MTTLEKVKKIIKKENIHSIIREGALCQIHEIEENKYSIKIINERYKKLLKTFDKITNDYASAFMEGRIYALDLIFDTAIID
jgi:hypothetical protein